MGSRYTDAAETAEAIFVHHARPGNTGAVPRRPPALAALDTHVASANRLAAEYRNDWLAELVDAPVSS
jgi:hypothetical protein